MNVTQFRLGNYVQNIKGDILRVELLDIQDSADTSITAWGVKNSAFGSSDDMIFPIPLTEEILLKCGFREKERYFIKDYIQLLKPIGVHSYRHILFSNGKRSVEIQHLHQLQNLYFALTNEELTINL